MTDGSREDFSSLGGFEVAGAGVYLPASVVAFDSSSWRTAEEYGDARLELCRAFLSVPGVMQTVQRAEFWGAIVAMHAYWPCHLGIDNLNVDRTFGRLLDTDSLFKPRSLIEDGDLVALVQYESLRLKGMLRMRMSKLVGFVWRINWGTLRLILLMTWVVVISLKCSLILGVGCSKLVVIGILLCLLCIGLWLLLLRLRFNRWQGWYCS